MKKHILLITLLFTSLLTHAQVKIGDNPTTINPSSLLELESTNKALLITRVPSVASVNNPVDGMIVYDIAMKCTRAFQDGIWSECLGVSTGGSVNFGALATELRFKNVIIRGSNAKEAVGLTLDGKLYYWGIRDSPLPANVGTPQTMNSPWLVQFGFQNLTFTDFAGDAPSGTLVGLTPDGKIYAAYEENGTYEFLSSGVVSTARQLPFPAGVTKFLSMNHFSRNLLAIGDNGKAYMTGSYFFGTSTGNTTNWGTIAKPAGAPASFEYVSVVKQIGNWRRMQILEGNDGKYYAIGAQMRAETSASFHGMGNPSKTSDYYEKFANSSNIIEMSSFPAGKKIKTIRTLQYSNIFIMTDGSAYFIGANYKDTATIIGIKLVSPGSPDFTTTTFNYYYSAREIKKPTGHTGFRDIMYMPGSEGGVFIMEDGTAYFVGIDYTFYYPISGNPLNSEVLKTDYVEAPLFTALDVQKMDLIYAAADGTGGIYFFDPEGQVFSVSGFFFPFAGNLTHQQSEIPIPLFDGDYDNENIYPENLPD